MRVGDRKGYLSCGARCKDRCGVFCSKLLRISRHSSRAFRQRGTLLSARPDATTHSCYTPMKTALPQELPGSALMIYIFFPLVGEESLIQEFVSEKARCQTSMRYVLFWKFIPFYNFLKLKNKNKSKLIWALPALKPIWWVPMDENGCGRMLSPVSSLLQAQLTCQLIYETSSIFFFKINHFLPSAPYILSPFNIVFNFSASRLSSSRLFFFPPNGPEILGRYIILPPLHSWDPTGSKIHDCWI